MLEVFEHDEYPTARTNVSMKCPRNPFQVSTMLGMGGSEKRSCLKAADEMRIGGGTDDQLLILKKLDSVLPDPVFSASVEEISIRLGLTRGCLKPLSVQDTSYGERQNLKANPGPSYAMAGFKNKGESLTTSFDVAKSVEALAKEGKLLPTYCQPRYGLAGRTKKAKAVKFEEKIKDGKPLGRAVWMADAHEAHIANKFVLPMTSLLHSLGTGVWLGFNKFSADPTRLSERMERFGFFINGDISSFDQNVTPGHIHFAIEIMRYAFTREGEQFSQDNNEVNQLLCWLEHEMTNTLTVLPTGKTYIVKRGIPSGAGATALVDSLINFSALYCCCKNLGVADQVEIAVSGDDNLIGGGKKGKQGPTHRLKLAKELNESIAKQLMENFSMDLDPEGSQYGHELFVGYITPIVPETLQGGSSAYLAAYWRRLEKEKGRKLHLFEKYSELSSAPHGGAEGRTHRWSYLMNGRAHFLSHYFRKGSEWSEKVTMIRPTAEVTANLLLPEGRVRSIDDHIMRLKSTLVENYDNEHVKNKVKYYLYDALKLKRSGVTNQQKLWLAERFGDLEGRFWYRGQMPQPDIEIEEPEFFQEWLKFQESASNLFDRVFMRFGISWMNIRNLRKGRELIGSGSLACRSHEDGRAMSFYEFKSYRAALGPLGVSLAMSTTLRDETSSLFIKAFSNEGNHRYSKEWLLIQAAVESARAFLL